MSQITQMIDRVLHLRNLRHLWIRSPNDKLRSNDFSRFGRVPSLGPSLSPPLDLGSITLAVVSIWS
ncbi:MAG: hypothetical protein JWN70_6949 [Planctomycetaceae bacterium]|nr:hypothetical protein [Planctomycetaceae bacterium]